MFLQRHKGLFLPIPLFSQQTNPTLSVFFLHFHFPVLLKKVFLNSSSMILVVSELPSQLG